MTVARTTLLDLPVITTGTESGVWGDYTNNGLTQYLDIAIGGISSLTSANFTTGALTIETTEGTNSGTNIVASSAQYATFRVSSLAQNSTITVGNTGASLGRSYRLINDDSTYTITFKATGQTGVTLQPGQTALVAYNGTDYKLVGTIGPTVPVARGGTGLTTGTSGGVPYFSASTTIASSAALAANAIVIGGGAGSAPATTTTGTGILTFLGTPSSANLAAAVTDETGSGALVFATSPTLVTPVLGTPTSGTLSGCTVDGTDAVGFRNIPQNVQTGNYTLVLADSGKHIYRGSGSAATWTIPANSSVAYAIGTALTFINLSATSVSIAITTDTMYLSSAGTTGTRTLAQYGSATAIKIASTTWIISGSGLT